MAAGEGGRRHAGDSGDDAPTTFEHKNEDALEAALVQMGVKIRYNLRAARAELQTPRTPWRQMTDRSAADLRRTIAVRFSYHTSRGPAPLKFGRESWLDYTNAILFHREVDPVAEWLKTLPDWDQETRVDDLLTIAFEIDRDRTPDALARWASRYLTLGAVRRTMVPGVKQDEMPVIVGPQKIGKSTLLEYLLPAEHRADWYSPGLHLAGHPQERAEALQGRLIVEAAEMAGSTRAELESLKAFLTSTNDGSVRLAYRHNPEPMLRRCIIVGTTNEAALPNDPTGNRRFVAVHVKGGADGGAGRLRDYLDEHRDQLWAEALRLYRQGAEAWLPPELHATQADANEHARRRDELIEDRFDVWLAGRNGRGFTLATAVAGCGLAPDEDMAVKVDVRTQRRVSAALRGAGFERRRSRVEGTRTYLWERVA